jgi:hypothetical protein
MKNAIILLFLLMASAAMAQSQFPPDSTSVNYDSVEAPPPLSATLITDDVNALTGTLSLTVSVKVNRDIHIQQGRFKLVAIPCKPAIFAVKLL